MATNKNASIRYQVLDKCFRDRYHKYYIDDLIEQCNEALLYYNGKGGVSRRQIFDDMKYMESSSGWNIPLLRKKTGRNTYYCYEDPEFTINAQPLTDDEAQQLETAILTLSRFRGMPCNEWIDDVISNLEWRFNLKRSEHNVIAFEQNEQLRGIQYLSPIVDATVHQQVLKVTYQSYKELSVERILTVHPYFLKEYNNRWYLIAKDNSNEYVCNLALDRIHAIERDESVPYKPTDIDFETYFDDVIGVSVLNDSVFKEHIVLRTSTRQFSYLVSKPLHPSQKIVDQDEHIISIDVKPNYELDYNILSQGSAIEVLEPASYRAHIKAEVEQMYNKYK